MFRTADGMGVSQVFLSGYTQAPAEKGRRFRTDAEKSLAKTALGAEYSVPWDRTGDLPALLGRLRGDGFRIVSLESGVGGWDIRSFEPEGDIALLVGNETEGIGSGTLATSDVVLEIPMRGSKESLNVSVAAAIALFALSGFGDGKGERSR